MVENRLSEDQEMTLIEHLTELRTRLIYALIFILLGFFASWGFSEYLMEIIRRPIAPFLPASGGGLIFTAPMDKFLAHLKLSILSGVILTTPLWLYQVWKFIAPGLYQHERKYAITFVTFGSFLFLLGVSFVYFIVYPLAFDFLMNFGGSTDQPMITIKDYLSFFMTTTLVFGAAFEMPLILTVLGMVGIIDAKFLKEKRRYAIVILAALSAVFTPPDMISMILMLIPMLGLYEISVVLVGMFGPKKAV